MNPSRRTFLKAAAGSAALAAMGSGSLGIRADASGTVVLGLIFPPANTPVPPEARLMYPSSHFQFIATGLGLERMTPDGYDKVIDHIIPAAKSLAAQGAGAIDVMGTSLTFYKGKLFNAQLEGRIVEATHLPAVTMSTAIVRSLHTLRAQRLAVATAYNEEVNHRLRSFLHENDFDVLSIKGMGIERFEDRPPVTQDELIEFTTTVWKDAPKADAILISCGALKTLEILAPLEQRCGVPVVSSLPTALQAGIQMLGNRGRIQGYGTALATG